MFGLAWSEIALILVIALVVMDPKDIPALARSVRDFMKKLQSMKQEVLGVLHDIDRQAGFSEVHYDLKQEAHNVNRQMRQIVDLEGNLQEAYDVSLVRPDLREAPTGETPETAIPGEPKKTIH